MLWLHLCCNSPGNGEPSGLLPSLSLHDPEMLTLESPFVDRHLRCFIGKSAVRLGRYGMWPIFGHHPWWGNWCHDGVLMRLGDVAVVLDFCISKGYRPTVGAVEFWDVAEMESGRVKRLETLLSMVEAQS